MSSPILARARSKSASAAAELPSSWPRSLPAKLGRTHPKQRRHDARNSPRKAPPRGSWLDADISAVLPGDGGGEDDPELVPRLGDSGCWDAGIEMIETVFEMQPHDIERYVGPSLREYFEHGDAGEVLLGIEPLAASPGFYPKLVAFVVTEAVERTDDARRLASELLVRLEVASANVRDGFDLVMARLPELMIDCPEAPSAVAKFVAKCVLDQLLAPEYLLGDVPGMPPALATEVFGGAAVLRSRSAATSGRVWTRIGPRSSLADIAATIDEAVAEYRDSHEVAEVAACVAELRVPHFHHQLVFATILSSLEHGAGGGNGRGDMHALLSGLGEETGNGLITLAQMEMGVRRLYAELPSIQLDLPWAYVLLHKFVADAVDRGYLPAELAALAPQKPRRKRRHTISYD